MRVDSGSLFSFVSPNNNQKWSYFKDDNGKEWVFKGFAVKTLWSKKKIVVKGWLAESKDNGSIYRITSNGKERLF